jgi:hypothetical protein
MTRGFLLALLLAGLTACKKQEPAAVPQGNAPADATSPALGDSSNVMPAPPLKIISAENGGTDATLGQLSIELRKYVMRTRTAPKNFEEFAANTRLEAPAPPEGKKYAISRGAVVLVNR